MRRDADDRKHPHFYRYWQIAFDETVFRKQMKELERAAENECPDICERVKRMVPEYQYEGEKKHDGPSYTYSAGG